MAREIPATPTDTYRKWRPRKPNPQRGECSTVMAIGFKVKGASHKNIKMLIKPLSQATERMLVKNISNNKVVLEVIEWYLQAFYGQNCR